MKDKKSTVVQLLIYISILTLLVLASLNIKHFVTPVTVLGISNNKAPEDRDIAFWTNFLKENPDYIPGWIELGRIDKVLEIDPNYFIHKK